MVISELADYQPFRDHSHRNGCLCIVLRYRVEKIDDYYYVVGKISVSSNHGNIMHIARVLHQKLILKMNFQNQFFLTSVGCGHATETEI